MVAAVLKNIPFLKFLAEACILGNGGKREFPLTPVQKSLPAELVEGEEGAKGGDDSGNTGKIERNSE